MTSCGSYRGVGGGAAGNGIHGALHEDLVQQPRHTARRKRRRSLPAACDARCTLLHQSASPPGRRLCSNDCANNAEHEAAEWGCQKALLSANRLQGISSCSAGPTRQHLHSRSRMPVAALHDRTKSTMIGYEGYIPVTAKVAVPRVTSAALAIVSRPLRAP